MSTAVVDLFAGPGGWDIAATQLGFDPLGIEYDDAACATRKAAGLRTIQADVSALDPMNPPCRCDFQPAPTRPSLNAIDGEHASDCPMLASQDLWGLIGSPPCQAFSMAGQGVGRRALSAYEEAIERSLEGKPPTRAELDEACEDERGHLVLEQVEPVLPLWEAIARGLRESGYSAWTGVLSAERYGVPQTRKRAILIARRDGIEARCPPATHRGYRAPDKRFEKELSGSLFEFDEPPRPVVAPEDRDLLPWVSMADALGWNESDAVGFPRLNDVEGDEGTYRERDLRDAAEPCFTLTEKARSWTRFRASGQTNAAERGINEPAPTITAGHDWAERRRLVAGAVRVTEAEAAALQSFPAGYPFQGTRTKRFEQIGNAIPPLLALAILREVTSAE